MENDVMLAQRRELASACELTENNAIHCNQASVSKSRSLLVLKEVQERRKKVWVWKRYHHTSRCKPMDWCTTHKVHFTEPVNVFV